MNYGSGVEKWVSKAHARKELDRVDGCFEGVNPVCGDSLRFEVKITEGRITGLRWKGYGCPPTLAAAEIITTLAEEKKITELSDITFERIFSELPNLPETSRHAVELALEVFQKAIGNILEGRRCAVTKNLGKLQ